MTKSFNINYNVRVKLTEHGKQMLEQDHNEFFRSIGRLEKFPYKPRQEDENGYVKFQLWELMKHLGMYCGLGREMPFDTVILIDENDLKEVKGPKATYDNGPFSPGTK
jgi:hypothetical protein